MAGVGLSIPQVVPVVLIYEAQEFVCPGHVRGEGHGKGQVTQGRDIKSQRGINHGRVK